MLYPSAMLGHEMDCLKNRAKSAASATSTSWAIRSFVNGRLPGRLDFTSGNTTRRFLRGRWGARGQETVTAVPSGSVVPPSSTTTPLAYTPMGSRYLQDILDTVGYYVDALKFAGGSFRLMPRSKVKELIEICHAHNVLVSTGGFIEYVLTKGSATVRRYLRECKEQGFDIVEVSSGFVTMPADDFVRLVETVLQAGLKAKPEVGIQFGAGGASATAELAAEGTRDPQWAIAQARRCLDAGADLIMIESEGITENVTTWRTDVVAHLVGALGLDKLMFEAADPAVFAWYVKSYGPDVNLFVDHSQIVQLECMRSGIWGTKSLWGRVVTYHGNKDE